MGCAQGSERVARRDNITRALTKSQQISVGRISREDRTVYATMQPIEPPPLVSMGVEGVGSGSGALEVVVKSEAKKSIGVGVYVVCELRC
jgi:hypothetical protein